MEEESGETTQLKRERGCRRIGGKEKEEGIDKVYEHTNRAID